MPKQEFTVGIGGTTDIDGGAASPDHDAFDPKRASRPYGTIIVKIMLCLKPAG